LSKNDYLAQSRAAGEYMQAFIRKRRQDFSEAAIRSSPKKGWCGAGVDEAHNAAMFLWKYTDEHFLNCRIPEDYGSPEALTSALDDFKQKMAHLKNQLEKIMNDAGEKAAPTVKCTYEYVKDTVFATDETLKQLAGAAGARPGNSAAIVAAATPSPMETVLEIANRFSEVVARMKERRKGRQPLKITDEHDVQYLFQGLLSVPFQDVRPEEPTPSVGGGSGRADTLLKAERIVVEYKCTRQGLGAKELRKQIADDFLLYGKHADCTGLFVFVYDPNQHVPNLNGFEADFPRTADGLDEIRIAIRR